MIFIIKDKYLGEENAVKGATLTEAMDKAGYMIQPNEVEVLMAMEEDDYKMTYPNGY